MSSQSKKTQKLSAEIVVADEDLLTEILVRLPVKSLLRFKCVSTQWLHLISSVYFSQKHTLKNPNISTCGLFLYQYPSLLYLTLNILNIDSMSSFGPLSVFDFLKITPNATNVTILSSCCGLLLCLLIVPPRRDKNVIYFVCNPTTKTSHSLPPLENLAKRPIINMDLAFDPRESPHYRAICIRHCNPPDGPDFEIQIYSSESGSWRTCPGPFRDIPTGIRFRGGVYWNKGIHYLSSWVTDSFYFKIEDESVEPLPMPPVEGEIHSMKRCWHMGQSGGHLHLVDIQIDITRDSSVDIYELMTDYSGWEIRFRVDLDAMGSEFPEIVRYIETHPYVNGAHRVVQGRYYDYCVLSVIQKEDEDFVEVVMSIQNKIICYNPRDNTSKVLLYFGDDRDRLGYEWSNVDHYIETLSAV